MPVVLIPWRHSLDRVAQALWVKLQWMTHHPDWEVRFYDAPEGPWCKAAAVMDAAAEVDAEVVVIADADVWCDGIAEAVEAVGPRHRWAAPHVKVRRLTKDATAAVLFEQADPWEQPTECRPYNGMLGGGIVAVDRETLLEVPFDRRFVGWGREDCAWRDAMLTLAGKPWRGDAPLLHLWHPPQPRPLTARTESFPHNEALYARYIDARKRPDEMKVLIAEAMCATTPEITEPLEDACMYRYRNENNGEVVESETPKPRLDRLPNWHLIGGEGEEAVEVGEETLTPEELAAELAEMESDDLQALYEAVLAEGASRGLFGIGVDEPDVDLAAEERAAEQAEQAESEETPEEGTQESENVTNVEAPAESAEESEQADESEIDATDAAVELATSEGIDLATVTGTGDGGRIVLDDVRKAVEAKD